MSAPTYFAAPVWGVSTVVAAPAASAEGSNEKNTTVAPTATVVTAAPLLAPNAFFWPPNSPPPKFAVPTATNYKRWRNTKAELGRFDQWTRQFASVHGLM